MQRRYSPRGFRRAAKPLVHIRYYPEVWHESVRWTFSLEAAISKEYLSAEDSSRESAWASLGMLSERMCEKLLDPSDPNTIFHSSVVPQSGMEV